MEETLLYIIGMIAIGQTGLLLSLSRSVGKIEGELPSMITRLNQLERRHT